VHTSGPRCSLRNAVVVVVVVVGEEQLIRIIESGKGVYRVLGAVGRTAEGARYGR